MRIAGFRSRAGSGVVRIDMLHFLARCRKRQLNQVLSVFILARFFNFVLFIRAHFYVSLILHFVLSVGCSEKIVSTCQLIG